MVLPELGVDAELPIIKKNKLSTGILELDIILEGGYVNPGNIMIIGPSSAEKSILTYHFVQKGLKLKNQSVVFITADSTPTNIKDKAASNNLSFSGENLYFIDCYSSTINAPSKEPNVTTIPGPQSLEDISFAITEMINKNAGKKLRLVFHTLSTFLLFNPKDSVIKFLQVISGRLRNADATAIFIVEEGVHDKQLISIVEHVMDERYTIVDKGGSLGLDIPSLGLSIPIKLGPSGITII